MKKIYSGLLGLIFLPAISHAELIAHLQFERTLLLSAARHPISVHPSESPQYSTGRIGASSLKCKSHKLDDVRLNAAPLDLAQLTIATWVKFNAPPNFGTLLSFDTQSKHLQHIEVWPMTSEFTTTHLKPKGLKIYSYHLETYG